MLVRYFCCYYLVFVEDTFVGPVYLSPTHAVRVYVWVPSCSSNAMKFVWCSPKRLCVDGLWVVVSLMALA